MDYIRLADITNQYPNIVNYVRKNDESVTLFGLYRETNKLDFTLPSIEHITPIDDVKTRLIFGFRKNFEDTNIKYYTSNDFYSDIESSNIEGNPYFYLVANKIEFIVLVDLERSVSIFESLKEIENSQGIKMKYNNFINEDSSINYQRLVGYLDWVLSKPSLDEIDTDGVIPADRIAEWEVGDFDPITLKWTFNKNKNTTSGNRFPIKQYKFIKAFNASTLRILRRLRGISLDKRFIVPTDPRNGITLPNLNSTELAIGDTFYGIIVEENYLNDYKLFEIFNADGITKRGFLEIHNNDELIEVK